MRHPRRGGWLAAVIQAAALVALFAPAAAAAPAARIDAAAIEAALAALRGADLAVIEQPAPGAAPSVLVATRVAVAPAALAATLATPSAYHEAIPALVRAAVVDRRRAPGAAVEEQLLEWELEIPLFNLKGKAWIAPRADGVDLTLVEGDLAPGKLTFTWTAAGPGTTILVLQSQANVRAAGWLFRRVVSRSPFGESAMNLTAAYVVMRAAAERAQHPTDAGARRPRAAPAPPALPALIADGPLLAEGAALAPFLRRGTVAAVRRAASGRLAVTTVAVPSDMATPTLRDLLARPATWSAFPGWHKVKPVAGDRVEIEDNLPFVDFETTWQLHRDRATGFSAVATGGAIRGAAFAWDARPLAGDPARSLAVLSLYPRLETSGYVPRKFIAAEPLLEHGIALALAYVDAMSVVRALERGVEHSPKGDVAPPQGTQNPTR